MENFEKHPLQGPGYKVQLEIEASCGCYGETDYFNISTVESTRVIGGISTFEPAAYEDTAILYAPSHGSDHDYAYVKSVQPQ